MAQLPELVYAVDELYARAQALISAPGNMWQVLRNVKLGNDAQELTDALQQLRLGLGNEGVQEAFAGPSEGVQRCLKALHGSMGDFLGTIEEVSRMEVPTLVKESGPTLRRIMKDRDLVVGCVSQLQAELISSLESRTGSKPPNETLATALSTSRLRRLTLQQLRELERLSYQYKHMDMQFVIKMARRNPEGDLGILKKLLDAGIVMKDPEVAEHAHVQHVQWTPVGGQGAGPGGTPQQSPAPGEGTPAPQGQVLLHRTGSFSQPLQFVTPQGASHTRTPSGVPPSAAGSSMHSRTPSAAGLNTAGGAAVSHTRSPSGAPPQSAGGGWYASTSAAGTQTSPEAVPRPSMHSAAGGAGPGTMVSGAATQTSPEAWTRGSSMPGGASPGAPSGLPSGATPSSPGKQALSPGGSARGSAAGAAALVPAPGLDHSAVAGAGAGLPGVAGTGSQASSPSASGRLDGLGSRPAEGQGELSAPGSQSPAAGSSMAPAGGSTSPAGSPGAAAQLGAGQQAASPSAAAAAAPWARPSRSSSGTRTSAQQAETQQGTMAGRQLGTAVDDDAAAATGVDGASLQSRAAAFSGGATSAADAGKEGAAGSQDASAAASVAPAQTPAGHSSGPAPPAASSIGADWSRGQASSATTSKAEAGSSGQAPSADTIPVVADLMAAARGFSKSSRRLPSAPGTGDGTTAGAQSGMAAPGEGQVPGAIPGDAGAAAAAAVGSMGALRGSEGVRSSEQPALSAAGEASRALDATAEDAATAAASESVPGQEVLMGSSPGVDTEAADTIVSAATSGSSQDAEAMAAQGVVVTPAGEGTSGQEQQAGSFDSNGAAYAAAALQPGEQAMLAAQDSEVTAGRQGSQEVPPLATIGSGSVWRVSEAAGRDAAPEGAADSGPGALDDPAVAAGTLATAHSANGPRTPSPHLPRAPTMQPKSRHDWRKQLAWKLAKGRGKPKRFDLEKQTIVLELGGEAQNLVVARSDISLENGTLVLPGEAGLVIAGQNVVFKDVKIVGNTSRATAAMGGLVTIPAGTVDLTDCSIKIVSELRAAQDAKALWYNPEHWSCVWVGPGACARLRGCALSGSHNAGLEVQGPNEVGGPIATCVCISTVAADNGRGFYAHGLGADLLIKGDCQALCNAKEGFMAGDGARIVTGHGCKADGNGGHGFCADEAELLVGEANEAVYNEGGGFKAAVTWPKKLPQ